VRKILLRSLLGAACGAISGAALLGLPTYFSTKTDFVGPESAWWPLTAIFGGFWGFFAGALIGFLVAKYHPNKLISAIVGAGVGSSLVAAYLVSTYHPFGDSKMLLTVLACIPIGAVISVIISATNKPVRPAAID
jgi:hypothetical protein